MHDRNNPLKNIPPRSFTIIQASHSDFHKNLADIPIRYPAGRITCINNHQFVPLLKFLKEHQGRLEHLKIPTLHDLLATIESDTSAVLFIEYYLSWFRPDRPEEMLKFNTICRIRAHQGGPVVLITAIMDRTLLELDGKADYFYQMGKIRLRGKCQAIREQTHLDSLPAGTPGPEEKGRLFGQMKLVDW